MRPTTRARLSVLTAMSLAFLGAPLESPPEAPDTRLWSLPVKAGPVRFPGEFAMVGVNWPKSSPDPAGIQVRTSRDGLTWSGWTALEVPQVEEGPDLGREDRGLRASSPLWVGRARLAQVKVDGPVPAGAAIQAIDPGPDPVQSPSVAHASPGQPGLVTRGGWGADESIRRGSPGYAPHVRMAFVHHTVTGNDYGPGDSARIMRGIYTYHVKSNGWDDIGYNFLVDKFGRVFEGRAGGVDRAVIGAHSQGFNSGSMGAALIGTFSGNVYPPQAAWDGLQSVIAWKLDLLHIDPRSAVTMTSGGSNKWPQGSRVTMPAVSGHRDVGLTDCPGDGIYRWMPELRSAIHDWAAPKLYAPSVSPGVFTPNGDGIEDVARARVGTSGSGDWTVSVIDPYGGVIRSLTGTGSALNVDWDGRDSLAQVARHGRYRIRWEMRSAAGSARPAEVSVLLGAWPDDTFIREDGSPTVYRLRDQRLQHVSSEPAFLSHAHWMEIARVPPGTVAAYGGSSTMGVREGSLIIGSRPTVWLLSDGRKRPFLSEPDFVGMGYRWEALRRLPDHDISAIPDGTAMDPAARTHPNGTLVKGTGPQVYWVQNGLKRHVSSEPIFSSWFAWPEVVGVSDAELLLYPTGTPLGYRDGSLFASGGKVWLVSKGQRRHVPSPASMASLGLSWEAIRNGTESEAAATPEGPPV